MPARSSTSIVGNSSGLVPCHSATTGTRAGSQVVEQAWLVLHVAEHHDRVAVARLEDGRQGQTLVHATVGMTQDDVVAAGHRLDRERLDRRREERVAEVADDRADEHRRGAAQTASQRVRPIAELLGRPIDAFARLGSDRDAGRRVVEDPRHGALRDLGDGRDVAHPDRRAARRGDRDGP